MNNIAGEHFCEKTALGLVFSVRVRVSGSGSVSASVSFVVNIMFEIAGREVTRWVVTLVIDRDYFSVPVVRMQSSNVADGEIALFLFSSFFSPLHCRLVEIKKSCSWSWVFQFWSWAWTWHFVLFRSIVNFIAYTCNNYKTVLQLLRISIYDVGQHSKKQRSCRNCARGRMESVLRIWLRSRQSKKKCP